MFNWKYGISGEGEPRWTLGIGLTPYPSRSGRTQTTWSNVLDSSI